MFLSLSGLQSCLQCFGMPMHVCGGGGGVMTGAHSVFNVSDLLHCMIMMSH